ncbi:MAG: glycosyltransferase [Lachnospiraceae bacterium]|jgi:GT2 family glycosyltransferase|nr:glycosyltransferase [Lachnospiraceae bacterium]
MRKVTVIIPNYNGIRFLEDCFAALEGQTFRDFDVIVVDNGSSDGSVEWLRGYAKAGAVADGGMTVADSGKTAADGSETATAGEKTGTDGNGIGDGSETVADGGKASLASRTTLLALQENTGFSAAVNLGIRSTDAPYVVLLNNDTKADPHYLAELVKAMDGEVALHIRPTDKVAQHVAGRAGAADPAAERTGAAGNKGEGPGAADPAAERTGAAGNKGEGPAAAGNMGVDSAAGRRGGRIFSVSPMMLSMARPDVIDDAGDMYSIFGWAFQRGVGQPQSRFEKPCGVFSACAGAAIYRRAVFEEIGYFDEMHFAYLEDIDIGWRARRAGYENRYCPTARVCHVGSGTSGSKYNAFKVRLASRNLVYLNWKNMPLLQLAVNAPFLLVGLAVKALFYGRIGFFGAFLAGLGEGLLTLGKCKKAPLTPASALRAISIEFMLIWGGALYVYEFVRRRVKI